MRTPSTRAPSGITPRALAGALLATILVASLRASPAHAVPRGKRRPRGLVSAMSVQPGPQCHAGKHTLTYHGGDLVQHVSVFVIFWGAEWQTDPEHQAAAASLRSMFQQLAASEYGCSWREFALPGSPLGAGSYAGDEIIASAPVAPGQELDDAAIQARIAGAKLEILPGVGHFSAIEAPEEFAERALAFLDSIDTREATQQKDCGAQTGRPSINEVA